MQTQSTNDCNRTNQTKEATTMKKGKEKAPLNKAAVLRGMMIKNFGTGEQRSAGVKPDEQEKKKKHLHRKTEVQ